MTLIISKLFEYFSHFRFYTPIQVFINRTYIKLFNISLDEFDTIQSYKSLNSLFIRSLIKDRDYSLDNNILISPSDGVITECGKCINGIAMQIKGKQYSVADFIYHELGDEYDYINIYLSPKDYHRFHAPTDLIIKKIRFVKGALYPVNNIALKNIDNLFSKNKRVILECIDTKGDNFFIIAIGALNVGRIQIHMAPNIINQKDNIEIDIDNIKINKGDEIGYFEMGSTIVMITTKWCYNAESDKSIRYGDNIGAIQ